MKIEKTLVNKKKLLYAKPSEAKQKYQEWLSNGFCKLNPNVLYVEEMTE